MHKGLSLAAVAVVLAPLQIAGALAAELPKSTQKALAEHKLDAQLMDGIDAELRVPQSWTEGAAKEKETIILGTWQDPQFRAMTEPFRERYPGINLRYSRAGTAARGMRVLIALNEGRVVADVLTSIADATFQFIQAKALADLRDIPGTRNLAPEFVASDGTWASFKISLRCMAYNTRRVKKEDLPKTWDDLLADTRWRGGNLAVGNLANSWLLSLWGARGKDWGMEFTRRLFAEVQPQRRKEGMTAMTALTVAGEFHASIPAAEWYVQQMVDKGAPIDYHCPAPVPMTVSQIVMLDKSPRKNASKIFINWMLSREGQLMQYTETSSIPAHKAFQSRRFMPFAETVIGKPALVRDDALLGSALHEDLVKVWGSHWDSAEGAKGKRKK